MLGDRIRSRRTLIGLLVIVALVLSACPPPAVEPVDEPTPEPVEEPTPEPVEEVERLVIALEPPAVDSNRIWLGGWVNFTQFEPMLETLVGNDPVTGDFIPRLAERWEVSDDFREWTFYLRQGVPFHFGYGEFTAADVVHTYELITRDDSQVNEFVTWRDRIREVEVHNDYQVTFHFHSPFLDGLRLFSRTGGELYIVSKAHWDEAGMEGLDEMIVGTGVFQFKERRLGEALVLEAVEDHWRDGPDFQEIEMRWVPDDVTRLAMLLTGEAQLAIMSRDVSDDALAEGMVVFTSGNESMQVQANLGGLYFAGDDPHLIPDIPWTDERVREAVNRAIDREEIIETIYRDRAIMNYRHGFHPDREGWNPEWVERFDEMYGYDPERARELLAEAGYGPGDLQTTIYSYALAGQPEIPLLAEATQLYLADIGIDATIEPVDFGTFLDRWRAQAVQGSIFITRNFPIRTVQGFIDIHHTIAGFAKHFTHDFLEERYAALVETVDPEEREQIAREIGDFLFENYTEVPLVQVYSEIVADPAVVADWTWPGTAPTGMTHYYMIKRAE